MKEKSSYIYFSRKSEADCQGQTNKKSTTPPIVIIVYCPVRDQKAQWAHRVQGSEHSKW